VAWKFTDVRVLELLPNALFPIDITAAGIFTEVMDVESNEKAPIVVRVVGKLTVELTPGF
jgi:hypothetical protein